MVREQRNWFCHNYCTPDAEYEGSGMAWAVRGGQEKYEDLLQKVRATISALTALLDNETVWTKFEPRDWRAEFRDGVDEGGEKDEKDGEEYGYDSNGDVNEMDFTLVSSGKVFTPSSDVEATTPNTDYYEHDDGILTRPLRFLYFRSKLFRDVMEKVCNITWNRRTEYRRFYGTDTLEEMDSWTEGEVDKLGTETASVGCRFEEDEDDWEMCQAGRNVTLPS
jgi:hypothetical protein